MWSLFCGVVVATSFVLKVEGVALELTAVTGASTYAGTPNQVSVSYDVAGSSTSAGILCRGTSNCAPGDTAMLSTDVAQMPTAITVRLLGSNGWLIDSLSLNANGKACTILAAGSNLWLDDNSGYSQVKSFDLRSLCANLYVVALELTAVTGTLQYAGTPDQVSVSYDVAGSSTSAGILCRGTSNCGDGETAMLSTDVAQMPTAITVRLLGSNGWLIDSLSLNANGKACTILAAGSNQWLDLGGGYSQVKSFDLRSLCANLYVVALDSTAGTSAGTSAPSTGALVAVSACGGMLGGAAVVLAAILGSKSREKKQYTLLEG